MIDAHALTLAVAIESIVSIEFAHLGKLTSKEKEAIQKALEYLDSWENDIAIKERIKGSIKALLEPRVGDKMKALEKSGAITKAQKKSLAKAS
ncbi:MAG: hypothetical protein F6K14_02975 [Symploca sp. SIO2C1]|nr:hypothetical protein [Symploca sp. SIO2C1]